MSEYIIPPEEDFLPVQEVFSLRAIAMGVVAEQARRVVDRPKMTGYAIYESSTEGMGSGAVETYLGVIAKKLAYDYWQMTISFRSSILEDNFRYSNTLELNRFNWNQQGVCVGTKVFTDNYYPIVSSRSDESVGVVDTVEPHVVSWWRPLDTGDCDDITERMLGINTMVSLTRRENSHG